MHCTRIDLRFRHPGRCAGGYFIVPQSHLISQGATRNVGKPLPTSSPTSTRPGCYGGPMSQYLMCDVFGRLDHHLRNLSTKSLATYHGSAQAQNFPRDPVVRLLTRRGARVRGCRIVSAKTTHSGSAVCLCSDPRTGSHGSRSDNRK